ncbi:MAG TPA: chemotaxis protein CheR [Alphaproteobacteria bacterium]|nr:chemotaxis protein CheR [Alphaproteobacteria bacterium]
MSLSKENITFLKLFVEEKSGIKITDDKEYLLSSRLSPLIKKFSFENFNDLVLAIRTNKKDVISDAIEALTTNETHFFRDIKPFEFFQNEILEKQFSLNQHLNKIRILSAACSSGQEAYSLAIAMLENKSVTQKFEIVGIDINKKMVEKARQGIFSQFEIQRGLPTSHLLKYFDKIGENEWKIKPQLSSYCSFFEKNLFSKISDLGMFDVIFCRNVLIYFDEKKKKDALKIILECLKSGCYILLGASETTNLLPDQLEQNLLMRSAFRKL